MNARQEAAMRRAEGTAQRADRPRQRRAAEAADSSPHPAVTLAAPPTLRAAEGGHTDGYNFRGVASVVERGYVLWDMFGEYTEVIAATAFDDDLARDGLDVPLVLGHDQDKRIARTTNGTLRLSMSDVGLQVDADLDPTDTHVQEVVPKLRSGLVNEMSFAFRIEQGEWSPDFTTYRVERVTIHRGDVAIVGYGANPFTGDHTSLTETPARSDADAGIEARDELPAAVAPADEPANEQTTTPERSAVMDDATPEVLAAEVVEPPTTPEVREDHRVEELEARVADLLEQQKIRHNAEEAQTRMSTPAYDQVTRVGAESRTYRPDHDPKGGGFVRDVIRAQMGDYAASERLSRHMAEERTERGEDMLTRTAGTAAFAGLVVPQYLTDLVAPAAKAGRPFADAIRKLPLPADGMTVNISKITTATSTAVQTEGSAVDETDADDTLLSPAVQTIAGSQTVTRQAVERGSGALDVVLEDLGRSYGTTLDSTLINQATNGLTNVATGITYTDADPTAAELYPKVLQGIASVEAALLDSDPGDTIAVMHSRRWFWLQSQLSSTFPLIGQGYNTNVAGEVNPVSRYGSGFRGFLPSGTAVVVDNNISTALGAGTEDEIYFVSASNCFLWEDAGAPMMIRTDTGPSVKSLGVDVVVYGYAAYTHVRRAHAYKISGTGLIAPTW